MNDGDTKGAPAAPTHGSKGGKARAEKLSRSKRSRIARRAAEARWAGHVKPLRASHVGELKIGSVVIPCAVLEDGTRVISQGAFWGSLAAGNPRRGRGPDTDFKLPAFLSAKSLRPFISNDLASSLRTPVLYSGAGARGGALAYGIRAELTPQICDVWLKAREAGALHHQQRGVAAKAEILVRGLAHVGIVALVDEATGYQYDRARRSLAEILEKFISKDLARWVKTFDDDYYREIFRLRRWDATDITKRPGVVGQWTTDIVYARLAPGVLDKLREVTPRDERGRLKHKLFQRLTPDSGVPALREHLASVTTIMRLAEDWEWFMERLDRLHPKYNTTLLLPFKRLPPGRPEPAVASPTPNP